MPAQRYVDILTEAGFKAVFGVEKNKDILIGLLNVVLPAGRRVSDLAYSTTEVPGFTLSNKSVRLDLRCTGEDGSGYGIQPVYFVALLNTGVPKFDRSDAGIWRDRFVSEYTFREKISHEVVDETIFLNFVELNRFDKRLDDCVDLADKWFYSLKHMGSMEGLPEGLPEGLRVEVFERLFEACEIAKFTPDEKLEYEHDMMTERDYTNILNTYRAEGLAEGKAEGFAEGRLEGEAKGKAEGLAEGEAKGFAEGKTEVARAMKAKGLGMALISELTGLPKDVIRKL